MLRKKNYKDIDKFRKTRNAQKRRYYGKTICGPNMWTYEQDMLIMEHANTDTELSAIVGHSVKGIQARRHRLKKILSDAAGKEHME